MYVFHLSHIDLDGYGAQFIARYFFTHIEFYNANYGREVMARLQMIFTRIEGMLAFEERFRIKQKKRFLILITDVNLTLQEAKYVHERVSSYKREQKDVSVLLLDHHVSGEECAKIFDWYRLDATKCATKITFETLQHHYPQALDSLASGDNPNAMQYLIPPHLMPPPSYALDHIDAQAQDIALNTTSLSHASLSQFVEMINSVDMWDEEGYGFEFGKVALGLIASSTELNRFMFDAAHRIYKFTLLEAARVYLEQGAVRFDNAIFMLKKCALGGNPNEETMDTITSKKQAQLLAEIKEQCSIHYREKMGFLSYSMGGISVLANRFLRDNQEFDFYIDINARGNVSLRANGRCDVSALSKELFHGGGHKNAAGGKMEGFKESFFYDEIKEQVRQLIANKTGVAWSDI